MRQLGTTSGVLAGSALLRRASGQGSVSQIQLSGWRPEGPEGHEAQVDAWGESGCGNAKPRHLCRLLHMYVRLRQYCTQQVVSRPTRRLEQICVRWWEISPRRRPQAASLCFSTAGLDGRVGSLHLICARCRRRQTTLKRLELRLARQRAAGDEDRIGRAKGHTRWKSRKTGRETTSQAAMCLSCRQAQEQLKHLRLMGHPSNAGMR